MDCNLFKFCLAVTGASLDHGASNFIMWHKKLYDSCTNILYYLENFNYRRYILSLLMHFVVWYKITWKTRDKISDDCETNKLYIASKTIKSVDEVHQGNWFLVEIFFFGSTKNKPIISSFRSISVHATDFYLFNSTLAPFVFFLIKTWR